MALCPPALSSLLAITPILITYIPQSQTTCMIIYLVFFFKPKLFTEMPIVAHSTQQCLHLERGHAHTQFSNTRLHKHSY